MLRFFELTMVISIDQLTTNRPLMTGYNLYWPLVWSILILTGQLPTLFHLSSVVFDLIIFKVAYNKEMQTILDMYSNVGQIRPQTTELGALEHLKIPIYTYNWGE